MANALCGRCSQLKTEAHTPATCKRVKVARAEARLFQDGLFSMDVMPNESISAYRARYARVEQSYADASKELSAALFELRGF